MRATVWLDQAPYRLTAYGNGTALELRCGTRSVFLQGEDAAQMIDEMDAIEASQPERSPLPILWGRYELAAQEDE